MILGGGFGNVYIDVTKVDDKLFHCDSNDQLCEDADFSSILSREAAFGNFLSGPWSGPGQHGVKWTTKPLKTSKIWTGPFWFILGFRLFFSSFAIGKDIDPFRSLAFVSFLVKWNGHGFVLPFCYLLLTEVAAIPSYFLCPGERFLGNSGSCCHH